MSSTATTPYADAYAPHRATLDTIRSRDWGLLIDNEQRPAASGATFTTYDPATELPLAQVADGGAADVEAAVESGRRGFEIWRRYSPQGRASALRELAGHIRAHSDELGLLDALDGGSSVTSMRKDALWAADHLEMFADWALMIKGETYPGAGTGLHYSRPEPYGVVGRIIPFNHPVFFGAGKLGAPLMAGNAVILKPPPQAPLSAIRLGELIAEVLPPGVVNIVNGASPAPGVAIAAHPEIERIAFIGSERTGRDIQRVAAGAGVKHVSLELGGKNAMVVLGDADIEAAARGAVFGMNFTATQGESCGSNSRLLVHRSIADQVLARVVELVEEIEVGVPVSESTQMGALVSREHYERVTGYIGIGREEGALVATGGGRPAHLPKGLFVRPTVFSGVTPGMRIAQEEIFGPVLSVLTFDTDDEAVEIANGVRYGLTASVWTQDVDRAHRFVEDLQAGYVWINDSSRHFPGLPFGGVKASGLGKEESLEEILSFTQSKTVSIPRRGRSDFPDVRLLSTIQSSTGGNMMVIPREGGHLFRLYVDLGEVSADDARKVRATPVDTVIAKAATILHPYVLDVKKVAWFSVYEVGHRLAEQFDDVPADETGVRMPRVFILGDACHTHSAKGGQGMNVSLQDGFNLGWKLAHVLDGRASETLLTTYSAERKAIAKNLIDFDKAWSSMMARKAGEFADAAELPEYFKSTEEFRTGFRTRYEPSLIVGPPTYQDCAKGFPVGQRFASARVRRVADTNPVHLGHHATADGRWRIYVFADRPAPGEASALTDLAQWLTSSPDAPLAKLPEGVRPDDWFDLKVTYQQDHHAVELSDVPEVFRPRVGPYGLVDRERVHAVIPEDDIFAARGISRDGAVIVVRPDQYVAHVLPLTATGELAEFFARLTG